MDEKTQYEKAAVMVVDDNEMSLKVAARLLKQHGIIAETALSGKECMNLAGAKRYDLILMDHLMPEMDGVETLARLREAHAISESTLWSWSPGVKRMNCGRSWRSRHLTDGSPSRLNRRSWTMC